MDISAVICTYNGEKTLESAILCLVHQTLDNKKYEILIIDNASTDKTHLIAQNIQSEAQVHYIYEPILGLSQARNTGWLRSQGKYVAYLDDDAIAAPDWLERILEVFAAVPNVGALGGKVEPIWEVPPPSWMNDFLKRYLSVLDWSETPIALDESRYLIGANIVFPKTVLQYFGGFSVELGRKGYNLISNEDTELVQKIRENGMLIYYDPGIVVKHLVRSVRLNQLWFIKRWFYQGVSNAITYRNSNNLSKFEIIKYFIKLCAHVIINAVNIYKACNIAKYSASIESKHMSIHEIGFYCGLLWAKNK